MVACGSEPRDLPAQCGRGDGAAQPRARAARRGLTKVAAFPGPSTFAALIRGEGFHIVAFRGTQGLRDWLGNIDIRPREWEPGRGRVHSGFWNALEEIWAPLSAALASLAGPVFFTGHSLGAALAVLAAARIDTAHRPRAVYGYGCPRSGDQRFADTYPDVPVYRVVNNRDIVGASAAPAVQARRHDAVRSLERHAGDEPVGARAASRSAARRPDERAAERRHDSGVAQRPRAGELRILDAALRAVTATRAVYAGRVLKMTGVHLRNGRRSLPK